jgi:hypothetical protein
MHFMNTGTNDYGVAAIQARANAEIAGEPRWLHMYNGTFWISKSAVNDANAQRFDPPCEVRRNCWDASEDGRYMLKVKTDQHGCVVECEGTDQVLIIDISGGELRVFAAGPNDDPGEPHIQLKLED